ncbi:MAG TPA: hypothetical protein VGA13_09640 [Acidimicrobiales bacterium]
MLTLLGHLLRRRARNRHHQESEAGNLIVGLGIMTVVGMLSVALVARSTSTLSSVRRTQDFSGALVVADGGLSDAKYRIDAGAGATFSVSDVDFGDGTFDYTATKISDFEWRVRSAGLLNGVTHTLEATVSQESLYPYAIFTQQALVFNGDGNFNVESYDSATGATDTGNAVVGSNSSIVVNGGGGGDAQHYFTPNGSCSGCDNGVQRDGPKSWDAPTDPGSGDSQACPLGGIFPSTIDGQGGTPFRCLQDISFTAGATTISNPPAIIYVGDGYEVNLSGAEINLGGAGADFRILKEGSAAMTVGSGALAGKVNGVIYAPDTDLTVDGGQMHLDGSLVLNSLTINGNPTFTLRYDDSISDIVSENWKVADWEEVSSGSL